MNPTIRPITRQDVPAVYRQLVELVHHEGIADRLKMTQDRMEDELFGPKADWYGLVACQDTEIVGFCLYSYVNTSRVFYSSTLLLQINEFYIKPEYQRRGIGQRFLQEVARIAQRAQVSRIELWCLKNNDIAQAFYQKMGFKKLDFLDLLRIDVDKLGIISVNDTQKKAKA